MVGRWRRVSHFVFMWAFGWELIKNFVLDISGLRCQVGSGIHVFIVQRLEI